MIQKNRQGKLVDFFKQNYKLGFNALPCGCEIVGNGLARLH